MRAQVAEVRGNGQPDSREGDVLRVGSLDLLWVLSGQLLHVRRLLVGKEAARVGVPEKEIVGSSLCGRLGRFLLVLRVVFWPERVLAGWWWLVGHNHSGGHGLPSMIAGYLERSKQDKAAESFDGR